MWYAGHVALLLLLPKAVLPEQQAPYPCGNKKQILKMTNGKPECYLCGLRIFVTDPWDMPEGFSIDHVIPKSQGGSVSARMNKRPAHRLCNLVKEINPKPRTVKKLANMKSRLRARMKAELDKPTQAVV